MMISMEITIVSDAYLPSFLFVVINTKRELWFVIVFVILIF